MIITCVRHRPKLPQNQNRKSSPADQPALCGVKTPLTIKDLKAGDYGASFADEILGESNPIEDGTKANGDCAPELSEDWQMQRAKEYARSHGYMLAHICRPSKSRGQKFEISVFVIKHEKGSSSPPRRELFEIESAEFFFGESWGNRVFKAIGDDGFFGVRTHAWGTFLASCRLTFKDRSLAPVVLYRYVDFFMADSDEQD